MLRIQSKKEKMPQRGFLIPSNFKAKAEYY